MIWRSDASLLVEEAGRFTMISESGELRVLEPREWSIDSELGRDRYFVRGSELVRAIERYLPREVHSEEIVMSDLVDVSDDPDIIRAVEAFMVDASVIALERERKLRERRTALEQALPTSYPSGKLSRHAQPLLHQRAIRFDDRIAIALLGTLASLARHAAPEAVIDAYATGCLFACFVAARTVPELVHAALAPELVAELAQRASELDTEGQDQSNVDAHNNAAAYFRAAAAVRAAIGRS